MSFNGIRYLEYTVKRQIDMMAILAILILPVLQFNFLWETIAGNNTQHCNFVLLRKPK